MAKAKMVAGLSEHAGRCLALSGGRRYHRAIIMLNRRSIWFFVLAEKRIQHLNMPYGHLGSACA